MKPLKYTKIFDVYLCAVKYPYFELWNTHILVVFLIQFICIDMLQLCSQKIAKLEM